MSKLWVRLAIAFVVVVIVAISVTGFLANRQVATGFRRFMMHSQASLALEPELVEYYAAQGSWAGVGAVLPARGSGGMGQMRGMRLGAPDLVLADASGQIVYSETERNSVGGQLDRQQISEAVPLEWQDQIVGYLLIEAPNGPMAQLSGPAQAFLDQTNRALIQAGLIAGVLGILVSLVVARSLANPLGKLAAAAHQIAQGKLDHRVSVQGADEIIELGTAFNEMAHHLQQAEQLRRNLVADVAHELRTPVSVIQGNLQAILDDVYPLDKTEIATIYDETLTLSRLINDLRDLAQAEAGQLSLSLQSMPLSPLIESTVDLFSELAREKGVNLQTDLAARLPPAVADPDRVRQVLHNLLSNALRHTLPGGSIQVILDRDLEPANGALRVSVVDTGPGVSSKDLPHVFNRFWRADKSRARQQGGSGLGLAIAKQLIEAQRGQIGVDSEPGRGSRFWFTLPAVLADKQEVLD